MTVVHAPFAGTVLPMADVPDPVFAGLIVGAGLAVEPEDGATEVVAVSPIAGSVPPRAKAAQPIRLVMPAGQGQLGMT